MRFKDVEAALSRKFNFVCIRTKPHVQYELRLEGIQAVRTHVSHGNKADIGDKLLGRIARELRVKTLFLKGMVSCSNSRDDYYALLKQESQPQR